VSREMLRRLARRELAPREIAELLRHVGECEECARASASQVELDQQLAALQEPLDGDEGPWHPDHADLAAYADGTAGPAERELVATHVEDCELCREDLADLAGLRRPRPRRRVWRAAFAAAAALAAVLVMLVQRSDGPRVPENLPVVTTQPRTETSVDPEPPAPAPPRYANAEWERLVRTAIESERLPFPRSLDVSPDVLRGSKLPFPGAADTSPDAVRVPDLVPSGVVIDEVRPRFSWPSRAGATYVVSIFRGDRQVARSEPLTETRWTPAKPLARGRTYAWQVKATRGRESEIIPAPPVPPARFHIVSSRHHDELAEARRLHPDDHLLHAVLAARAGLREEALQALSRVPTNIRPE
jgi:hypothetical protein